MSRRDEYLDQLSDALEAVGWNDVVTAYDTGYQHGTEDAGVRIAANPSDIRRAAIADAVRVLDKMLAPRSYIQERTNALVAARERIAALAPAEPPPLTERAQEKGGGA